MTLVLFNRYNWYRFIAFFFYVIPDIQCLSSILVYTTQEHGIRIIAHTPLPSFGWKRKWWLLLNTLAPCFWNVDHQMVMLGAAFCYNIFSHLCVQHKHYPEHDNLYLSIFFTEYCFVFALINYTVFSILVIQMLLELFRNNYIIVLGDSVHIHLGIKCFLTKKLNIRHQLIYISLINSIESVYHFFAIPRLNYASISYNWVTLWHNWHKVYCRVVYILFSTTISVNP